MWGKHAGQIRRSGRALASPAGFVPHSAFRNADPPETKPETKRVPNPLLRRVGPEAMDDWLRTAYRESRALQESKGGDATFYEIGANAPELLEWYIRGFYGSVFYGGRVDVRMKELLRYRLSMTHGCAYCNKGNIEAARRAGLGDDKLAAVMDADSDVFTGPERAVLRLAAEMALTNMDGRLTPALYESLSAHFDDGEIFELGMVAAVLTGMAKFLFVYDLVEREAHCPVGPPPAMEERAAAE